MAGKQLLAGSEKKVVWISMDELRRLHIFPRIHTDNMYKNNTYIIYIYIMYMFIIYI